MRCFECVVQAVTFLVIHQKHKKSLEEITNDLCPVLSVQQLYRIRFSTGLLFSNA